MPRESYQFSLKRMFLIISELALVLGVWTVAQRLGKVGRGDFFLYFSLVPLAMVCLLLFLPRKYLGDVCGVTVGFLSVCLIYLTEWNSDGVWPAAFPAFYFGVLLLLVYPLQGRLRGVFLKWKKKQKSQSE